MMHKKRWAAAMTAAVLLAGTMTFPVHAAKDSVLLPGAIVRDGAKVINAIVGENSIIDEGVEFGSADAGKDYAFCGNNVVIGKEE